MLLRVSGVDLSEKYDYGFEDFDSKIEPDPFTDASGVGGFGTQYLGLDNDGTALMLFKHEYVGHNDTEQDNSPLEITLRLTNFVRNKNVKVDKVLAEGWKSLSSKETGRIGGKLAGRRRRQQQSAVEEE